VSEAGETILVNATQWDTRVALLDDGGLQDFYAERASDRGPVGNIYAGRVVRVLPGLESAFVDIGAARTGFIHVSDIVQPGASESSPRVGGIADVLHEGQKLIVQVTRGPLGTKGAQLTTELSVASRYLVLLPGSAHIGVSQRIHDPLERARLQQVLAQAVASANLARPPGLILRTAAIGVGQDELAADLRFLGRLWTTVQARTKAATAPELLYEDLPLHMRCVRDLARPAVGRIVVDNIECFIELQEFCRDYMPETAGLLEHYRGECPLFDAFDVEEEIQRALEQRVALKSGGYLVIDQTEAMTTIDVNTGSFVGRRNQAETILKTNLEAATVLGRQLRVRNLGGIIIVDFIDMQDAEHRREVLRTLEKNLQRDPARYQVSGLSPLGLVEITRKRTRASLEGLLCEVCPSCDGRGVVKSAQSVCHEIFRAILRRGASGGDEALTVLAAPQVVDRLLTEESAYFADVAQCTGYSISLQAEPLYRAEQFDITLR